MIDTADKLLEVLERDPDVDPEVFWPRVGVATAPLYDYANRLAAATGIPFSSIMACFETGAVLAEAGPKELEAS